MNTMNTKELIQYFREHPHEETRVNVLGMPSPFVLMSEAPVRENWDRHFLEARLGLMLPEDLVELWQDASGL